MGNEYLVKLSPTLIGGGKLMAVVYDPSKSHAGSVAPVLIEQDLSGNTVTSSGVRKRSWSFDAIIYYGEAPTGYATFQNLEAIFSGTSNAFAFQDMRGNGATYTVAIINKAAFTPRPLGNMCFEAGAEWRITLELRET